MWTPTTRMQHSRPVTRYQIDLTDAEWRVIAPHQKLQSFPVTPLGLLGNCETSQKRRERRQKPLPFSKIAASIGCSSIAGADVGVEARPPFRRSILDCVSPLCIANAGSHGAFSVSLVH